MEEEIAPLEFIQSLDEAMLRMVLLLRYESGHIEETLIHYENLHQKRKSLINQLSQEDGH
jgi:hypothetical protein